MQSNQYKESYTWGDYEKFSFVSHSFSVVSSFANKLRSITSRGSSALRPLGSLLGVKDKIIGSIRFHCSLVSSIPILLHNQVSMPIFISEL